MNIKRRNTHADWQICSKKTISLELEVMNSNPTYNILSESKPFLTDIDIINEHEEKIEKERFIIIDSLQPVAIIDFIMCNPVIGILGWDY